MQTPHVFVAAGPRGLECAVVYLETERDAYGWYIGRRHDGSFASAYFLLQDLFAETRARYESAPDVHAPWGLDEARRHELAQVQEIFAREWLEFGERAIGVRPDRAGRLTGGVYYSPNFQDVVLRRLSKHWPLDYRPNRERIAAEQKRRHAGHARP